MKGILLAGGLGTRLYPITHSTNKQLLPVYDKPMVYYPLTTLMEVGVRDILVISAKGVLDSYRKVLGDGTELGINLSYGEQRRPEGIAQALAIAKEFVDGQPCALILGDNLFCGARLGTSLLDGVRNAEGGDASLVLCHVDDPRRFGVACTDEAGNVISLEEKPAKPRSNNAATGLYFYPADVMARVCEVSKSDRGEYEITDLNKLYMGEGRLKSIMLGSDDRWFDAGTPQSLLEASVFVRGFQQTHGRLIGSPEAVACQAGWATRPSIEKRVGRFSKSDYVVSLLREIGCIEDVTD